MSAIESSDTQQRPGLGTLVAEVLGNLAFLLEDDTSGLVPAGAQWLRCEVSYEGPKSGKVSCWCTRDFARNLTANLLGLDLEQEEVEGAAEDALREFTNIVCGQLVTAWYGREAIFHLSIPQVHDSTSPEHLLESPQSCQLWVSGEFLFCQHAS